MASSYLVNFLFGMVIATQYSTTKNDTLYKSNETGKEEYQPIPGNIILDVRKGNNIITNRKKVYLDKLKLKFKFKSTPLP